MRRVFLALMLGSGLSAQAPSVQTGTQAMDQVLRALDAKRDAYAGVANQIWSFAELGYQEEKSSALLQSELRGAGFTVRSGVADIPTAFVATWGSGQPVIGIVGEFDALPGLSQKALPHREAVLDGGPGHG